jgi:hypothetical protein
METDFFDMCVFLWCHGHQVRRQPIDRSVPVRVCTHVRTVLDGVGPSCFLSFYLLSGGVVQGQYNRHDIMI